MAHKLLVTASVIFALANSALGQNYAIQFDGVDDYVNMGNHPEFDIPSSLTIECCVKISALDINYWTDVMQQSSTLYGFMILPDSTLHSSIYNGIGGNDGPGFWGCASSIKARPGEWHHLAMTFDGLTEAFYIDGTLASSVYAGGPIPFDTDSFCVGKMVNYPGNTWLNGAVDEVRVWNIVRTQAEIISTASMPLNGSEPGLVAYYPFNEGSGTSTDDVSVNGNIGTLSNGPAWVPGFTTVGITSLSAPSFAPGESITANYVVFSPFEPGNMFTLELSDATGSFDSPIVLGSTSGTIAGSIVGLLPLGLAGCGNYYVRVTATNPALHGTAFPITIIPPAIANYAVGGNGAGAYVNLGNPSNAFDLTGELTLECWVRHNPTEPLTYEDVVMKGSASFGLQYSQIAPHNMIFHISTGAWSNVESAITPPLDEWFHVAGTYDGTEQKIYVNGELAGTLTNGLPIDVVVDSLTVGRKVEADNNWLNGAVDEVMLWNYARTPAEIATDMDLGAVGNEPGLLAYYRFDEGDCDVAADSGPLAGSGALVNGVTRVQGVNALGIAAISDSTLLPGQSIQVDFSPMHDLDPGNQFFLELSDRAGDFQSPQELASGFGTTAGSLIGTLPLNVPADCGYRLRIRSTSPTLVAETEGLQIGDIVSGEFNMALKFDGIDDYADLGSWFESTDFTVSFWMKPDSVQSTAGGAGASVIEIQNDLSFYSNPTLQGNYGLSHLLQTDVLQQR